MGRRGPLPKPSALKVLDGTYRKDRAPKTEPQPRKKRPAAPRGLGKEARAEWDRITTELEAMGLLFAADRALLVTYCEYWEQFIKATQAIRRLKSPIVKTTGGPSLSPWYRLRDQAADKLIRIAGHFGLSPSTRSRIEAERERDEDADELLD